MRQRTPGLVVALVAAVALPAFAGGDVVKSVRMWNPETVATVSGTVESVDRVEMGEWSCVRLRLRTDAGALQIRVGPDWFLTEHHHRFAAGEVLQVKGSRVTFAGEPAVVAGEIVRGTERIVLRDAAGKPAWAGK